MYDLYDDIQKSLSALQKDTFNQSKLRENYYNQVDSLQDFADQLKEMGLTDEAIAHLLYNRRHAMAKQYQDQAPALIKEYIHDVIYEQHRSPMGWSFEQLSATHTYQEIIETLTTLHGNLERWLTIEHFTSWLQNEYFQKKERLK